MYVSFQCSPNRRIHVIGMNVTNTSFKYLNTIYPLIWWQTTAAVENDKTISYKSQIGVYSFRNMKPCTSFGREGSSSIFSSINITSKVAQYMTIDEIANDNTHRARHLWHAPTGPCHHGQMMAAEKQTGHQLISNNHTESAMTTMSHGPYYAIHIYIAWQPLNKLCWERIRGSTPIGFCVIAGPFSLSDNAQWYSFYCKVDALGFFSRLSC